MSKANVVALLLCVLFVVLGSLWIWLPGIQSDEALFASGVIPPVYFPGESIRIFKHDFTVMIMSYVGALKGHLWTPVFKLWGYTAATIRFPALLIGAISIWCFYRLLLRTLGVRAALIGIALLATDPIYMLTIRWDWGPVALQHAFLVGGLLAIVLWWQTRRAAWLALAFFVFGLAMWDKALFIWSIAGLGVAVVAVFPREFFRSLTWKHIAIAAVAFLVGAFPFVRYNVRHKLITFRSNTVWTTEGFAGKAALLHATLDGSALFGSIMRDDWEQPVREPEATLQRAVVKVAELTGGRRHSIQHWLFAGSLLLLPLVWRTAARRAILFALVFMAVTWAQMAFVQTAGGGAHHTVLLWPMPQLVIAAAIAHASLKIPRGAVLSGAAVLAACVMHVLVLSTHYRNLIRNGGIVTWTDAVYRVVEAVNRTEGMEYLCVADWGFYDNVRVLVDRKVTMCVAEDPASDQARQAAIAQIANPKIYFVAHTEGNEVQPGAAARIQAVAQSNGFRKVLLGAFHDTNGRPAIEVFTFRPATLMK